MASDPHDISVSVNGKPISEPSTRGYCSSDFIRHDLLLAGTHVGLRARCLAVACTILLDGLPVRSCLLLAVQANGHESRPSRASRHRTARSATLQQAMHDHQWFAVWLLHARHTHDDDGLPQRKYVTERR